MLLITKEKRPVFNYRPLCCYLGKAFEDAALGFDDVAVVVEVGAVGVSELLKWPLEIVDEDIEFFKVVKDSS